jgi:hypothetical protein
MPPYSESIAELIVQWESFCLPNIIHQANSSQGIVYTYLYPKDAVHFLGLSRVM